MGLEIRILVTSGKNVDWEEGERSLLGSGNILYLDNDDSYTDAYINRNIQTLFKISSLYTFCRLDLSKCQEYKKKGKLKYHFSPIKLAKNQ